MFLERKLGMLVEVPPYGGHLLHELCGNQVVYLFF